MDGLMTDDAITINGRDIETMDRDELLTALRAIAPIVVELQAAANEAHLNARAALEYRRFLETATN